MIVDNNAGEHKVIGMHVCDDCFVFDDVVCGGCCLFVMFVCVLVLV